jgi:hypothetical protein
VHDSFQDTALGGWGAWFVFAFPFHLLPERGEVR